MENATPCPFCEWYHKLKDMDEYYSNNLDGRSGVTEARYGAALVHKTLLRSYQLRFRAAELLPDLWDKAARLTFRNPKYERKR